LLLLLVAVALAAGLEKHHHHHKKHQRGDAFVEVSHRTQHHAMKIEPCYPPPCPGYEYDLTEAQPLSDSGTTTPKPVGGTGGQQAGGGVVAGGGTGSNPIDNGGGTGSNNGGGGGGGSNPTSSDTGTTNLTPTPLPPDTPVVNIVPATASASASAGASGAAGAAVAAGSSSSAADWWIQIVHAPPDPNAAITDTEAAGCCNPTMAADRAKMLALQTQIDAQTEIRAGHIKWLQDAEDAITKVLRQIATTNETVYELTQDISVLETQIDQIRKKIRADKLQQDLATAQDELQTIQDNEASVAAQKDQTTSQQAALVEKIAGLQTQMNGVPQQNIQLVADKYDPNQQS